MEDGSLTFLENHISLKSVGILILIVSDAGSAGDKDTDAECQQDRKRQVENQKFGEERSEEIERASNSGQHRNVIYSGI